MSGTWRILLTNPVGNVADSESFPCFEDKVKFPVDDSEHKRHPQTKEIAPRIIKKSSFSVSFSFLQI